MNTESIIATVSAVIAAISLVVAILSLLEARRANQKSDEANQTSKEANEISESANQISQKALDLQRLHAPAPWSELLRVKDSKYQITNQSGRDIEIEKIDVIPTEMSSLVETEDLPCLVSYDDSYDFFLVQTYQQRVKALDFSWHYVDDPQQERHKTHRIVH